MRKEVILVPICALVRKNWFKKRGGFKENVRIPGPTTILRCIREISKEEL